MTEREKFEAAMRDKSFGHFTYNDTFGYCNEQLQAAWIGWTACRASTEGEAGEVLRELVACEKLRNHFYGELNNSSSGDANRLQELSDEYFFRWDAAWSRARSLAGKA
jgi:hypothetical protein